LSLPVLLGQLQLVLGQLQLGLWQLLLGQLQLVLGQLRLLGQPRMGLPGCCSLRLRLLRPLSFVPSWVRWFGGGTRGTS
jgi:hypothetical protein